MCWLLDEGIFVLYILDETTKGGRYWDEENIYELMVKLAERKGRSIVISSSGMPELISMSDRIGIMRHESMIDIVENKDKSPKKI